MYLSKRALAAGVGRGYSPRALPLKRKAPSRGAREEGGLYLCVCVRVCEGVCVCVCVWSVEALLDCGASLSAVDQDANTALHLACLLVSFITEIVY